MDKTDIEILTTLRSSIPKDLNGIKRTGMDMPDTFDLEIRLFQLQDQQFIKKIDEKCYRITHNGKNQFWKENDEKNNIMRLLKVSKLTDNEMKRFTGLDGNTFKETIHDLFIANLILPVKTINKDLLYELTPKGHQRIKLISELPTQIIQNFITNIDNVQINNSITIIQTNIEQLIIQVEKDNNLTPDQKTNIISKLKSLKEIFSTAEPYVRPYLIQTFSENIDKIFSNG